MTSRAQLAYPPAPEGWRDEEFEYSFDLSSNVAFATVLAPGQPILDMVLETERDAEFRWRAIQVSNPGSFLGLRFRTPDGTYMAEDFAPMENFSGFPGAQGGVPGGMPIALEAEIVCPPGSTILLDAANMV